MLMIKNIVLDIGGVLFDNSQDNIDEALGHPCHAEYRRAYMSDDFQRCMLGKMTVSDYIASIAGQPGSDDIEFMLSPQNYPLVYPLNIEVYEYVRQLRKNGYRIYLLSNATAEDVEYISSVINTNTLVDGAVYSHIEHITKPDARIYQIIIERYNLDPDETIFFDDRQDNVNGAIAAGLPAKLFRSVDDIKSTIEE